jgi:hypothetical protein
MRETLSGSGSSYQSIFCLTSLCKSTSICTSLTQNPELSESGSPGGGRRPRGYYEHEDLYKPMRHVADLERILVELCNSVRM